MKLIAGERLEKGDLCYLGDTNVLFKVGGDQEKKERETYDGFMDSVLYAKEGFEYSMSRIKGKKKKRSEKIKLAVRLILTGVLIYFSYLETGIFTAICLALMTMGIEVNIWLLKKG